MRSYGAPDKDREAEALINQSVRANPDATYMLVQSVLVQEQALEAANDRVQELEEQLRELRGRRRGPARALGRLPRRLSGAAAGGEEPRSSVPQVGARATPSAYDSRGDGRWSRAQSAAAAASSSRRPRPRRAAASCARRWRRRRASPAACWWPTASAT